MTTKGHDKPEEEDYVIDSRYPRIRWRKSGTGRAYVIGGVGGFPRPKPDETPAPQDREGDDGESLE